MIGVLRNAWPLLLGIALLLVGNSLQGTLLGVRGKLETFNTLTMGIVMAGYYAGFLVGSILTPRMLAQVGHVRVFAALGSLISGAFVLYAALVHPISWVVLRFMVGVCFSGLYVVAESWLNDISTNETRGQTLSLYVIIQMVGVTSGQFLLNVADPAGYNLFILISVLVSIGVMPILLTATPMPVFQTAEPMRFRELFITSPLGCVGMLALGGIYAGLFGMSSVYAVEIGLSLPQTSMFVSSAYIGGLLFQYPLGWLSDRMDRRILISSCFIIGAAACIAGWSFSNHWYFLLFAMLILGGTANPLYALLIAYTNDFVNREKMTSASGGLVFINGLGAMCGPLIIGPWMRWQGPSALFSFLFVIMSGTALYALYRMTQRPTPNNEDIVPYVPLPSRTTVIAGEIATEMAIEAMEEAEENTEQELATKP